MEWNEYSIKDSLCDNWRSVGLFKTYYNSSLSQWDVVQEVCCNLANASCSFCISNKFLDSIWRNSSTYFFLDIDDNWIYFIIYFLFHHTKLLTSLIHIIICSFWIFNCSILGKLDFKYFDWRVRTFRSNV